MGSQTPALTLVVLGAMPPLAQTQILRLVGPAHRSTAGALIPVLFNGAIAIGAGLASLVVTRSGVGALPVPAAIVVAVAVIGLANLIRTRRREQALKDARSLRRGIRGDPPGEDVFEVRVGWPSRMALSIKRWRWGGRRRGRHHLFHRATGPNVALN